MRTAILVTTVMTLAFAQAQSERPTSMPADVGPGRVAWFDITTTDLSRSKEFYGKLFDWKFNPVRGSDQAVEIVFGGSAIGTNQVPGREDQSVQRRGLYSGAGNSGKLQEGDRAGWNARSQIPLRPARRRWRHRSCP